jgi:hypothetical protein
VDFSVVFWHVASGAPGETLHRIAVLLCFAFFACALEPSLVPLFEKEIKQSSGICGCILSRLLRANTAQAVQRTRHTQCASPTALFPPRTQSSSPPLPSPSASLGARAARCSRSRRAGEGTGSANTAQAVPVCLSPEPARMTHRGAILRTIGGVRAKGGEGRRRIGRSMRCASPPDSVCAHTMQGECARPSPVCQQPPPQCGNSERMRSRSALPSPPVRWARVRAVGTPREKESLRQWRQCCSCALLLLSCLVSAAGAAESECGEVLEGRPASGGRRRPSGGEDRRPLRRDRQGKERGQLRSEGHSEDSRPPPLEMINIVQRCTKHKCQQFHQAELFIKNLTQLINSAFRWRT